MEIIDDGPSKELFPGYDNYVQNKKAREQIKTQKRQARKADQDYKRKTSLPPFLAVRAGGWLVYALELAAFVTGGALYKAGGNAKNIAAVLVISLIISEAVLIAHSEKARDQAKQIQRDLELYVKDNHLSLPNRDAPKKLKQIVVRHISKNNPEIFNKMLNKPNTVHDINLATDIILGHLKSNPEDANLVLRAFQEASMPQHLVKKLKRYAEREQ